MNSPTHIVNVADLKAPGTNKTYRQLNSEMTHKIPLNALVEVKSYGDNLWSYLAKFFDKYEWRRMLRRRSFPSWNVDYGGRTGLRLFVVSHDRDCDQTPLYSLSFDPVEKVVEDDAFGKNAIAVEFSDGMRVRGSLFVRGHRCTGFAEDSLKVIRLPKETNDGD